MQVSSKKHDRSPFGRGRLGVEVAVLLLGGGEQPVEVREVRDVPLDTSDVLPDVPDRLIELRLAAAGDVDVGALGDEPAGGGQADAAVAPGDDRDFPFQLLRHRTPPPPVRAVRVTGSEYARPPHHTLTTTLPI